MCFLRQNETQCSFKVPLIQSNIYIHLSVVFYESILLVLIEINGYFFRAILRGVGEPCPTKRFSKFNRRSLVRHDRFLNAVTFLGNVDVIIVPTIV